MQTTLTGKKEVAEGTMAFTFARPEGFVNMPGQSIDLTLINPPETDAEGNTRAYSLASAPGEGDLMIATRMRDTAFKRVLKNAPVGMEVSFEGPFGSFLLHERAERPAIFLAGGIGATPFRAIIADATARSLPHRITLFYSNRRPEDAPFLEEFADFAKKNPNFTFVPTMTDMEKSSRPWEGERGYIDSAMLSRHESEGEPVYYLAGPPAMVKAMRTTLNGMGVSNDDIRTEEFAGY